MRRHAGQSTVEAVGLAVVVGAVLAAATFALRAGSVGAIADALRGAAPATEATMPSPGARAFLEAALAPADAGPTVGDAILRLEPEIGRERAVTLVLDAALRRFLPPIRTRARALADPSLARARADLDGIGPPADAGVWADASLRAPPSARIIDIAVERGWRRGLRPSTAAQAIGAVAGAAAAAFGSLNPAAAVAVTATGALSAAGRERERGAPAGLRADDILLCRPVWRTNRAADSWIERHPMEAARLQLGARFAAVEVVIVRAGEIALHTVVRSDATRC